MKKVFKILGLVISVIVVVFFIYVNIYYKADEEALSYLKQSNVSTKNDYIEIDVDSEIGFIFYPGAKVEYSAYLPLMNTISKLNINVYIVDMPFNLSIFNQNAASAIMQAEDEIHTWYIGGHSLGGISASLFASENTEIEKLFLFASYNNTSYPLSQTLTIYGSEDLLVDGDIQYEKNVVVIEGGNHAQFGNYGIQRKDGSAQIDASKQQERTQQLMKQFIEE